MSPRIRSIQTLRSELAEKERRLAWLLAQRKKVVAKLDREIAALGGEAPGVAGTRGPKRRGRARAVVHAGRAGLGFRKGDLKRRRRDGGKPLIHYMKLVLGQAPKGMRAKDVMMAVQSAGYRSNSKDFYGIVAAALRDNKCFKRVRRGVYRLA